ncbi:MAG: ATP-binding protein [Desulfobacterales bacterium]
MTGFKLRFSFRTKIYAGIVSIVLLSGVLIALSVSRIVAQALSAEYRNRGEALAVSLARRGEDAILAMDFLRMKGLIEEVADAGEGILYAFILNEQGEVLSHTFEGGFPVELKPINPVAPPERFRVRLITTGKDTIYDFATPVMAGSYQVGTVRLGLLRNRITGTINELLWAIFAFILISVIIADLIGVTLAKHVTSRVQALQKATEEILKGNLNVRAGRRIGTECTPGVECHRTDCPASLDGEPDCWGAPGGAPGPATEADPCCEGCPRHPSGEGDEIQQLAESFDAMTFALRTNIDQLARSKATLEKSEAKYRRIFEGSMDLIFVADSGRHLLDVNPAGVALLEWGDDPGRLLAQNLEVLFKDAEVVEALFDALSRDGFVKDWECRVRTRSGRELDVLVSMTAHRDPEGRVLEYEGIVKDITRRKMLRNQLLQADKLASLGQLSAGVAHEINNPLGLILGYTQLLIREIDEESEHLEDLRTIEKQTRNCKKIVEALLNFARKTETQRLEVSLNDTVAAVIDVIGRQLELDGIEIRTEFHSDLPRIHADGEKLKQVWMNLLMNARQALGHDGAVCVSSGIDPEGRRVYLSVEDTGPGIPAPIRDRIFDPFFTTKPTGQGTGLGLSVSYGIIQDHHGSIELRSEEGMGAVFTVYLPTPESTAKMESD